MLMKDSSENKQNSAFKGVTYKQVQTLLTILNQYELNEKNLTQKRYNEKAVNFQETLELVKKLNLITEYKNGHLKLNESININVLNSVQSLIVSKLFTTKNSCRKELYQFFSKFNVLDGKVIYIPTESSRSQDSFIRNFLLELDVLFIDSSHNYYCLHPNFIAAYSEATTLNKKVSPTALKKILSEQDALGLEAEKIILDYEKTRLGNSHLSKIDHVSLVNTSAGYDIKSITILENQINPRFIEVKAVQKDSYQFFWTSNEVNVASSLGDWYYLYLIPVGKGNNFILNKLVIICNPCSVIFNPASEWKSDPDVFRCWLQ